MTIFSTCICGRVNIYVSPDNRSCTPLLAAVPPASETIDNRLALRTCCSMQRALSYCAARKHLNTVCLRTFSLGLFCHPAFPSLRCSIPFNYLSVFHCANTVPSKFSLSYFFCGRPFCVSTFSLGCCAPLLVLCA